MTVETLVLKVPSAVYARLKQSADQSRRSVEDEATNVLSAAVATGELTEELRPTIAALVALSDEQLWCGTSISSGARVETRS